MVYWGSIVDIGKHLFAKYKCWALGHQLDAATYNHRLELHCPRCGWKASPDKNST